MSSSQGATPSGGPSASWGSVAGSAASRSAMPSGRSPFAGFAPPTASRSATVPPGAGSGESSNNSAPTRPSPLSTATVPSDGGSLFGQAPSAIPPPVVPSSMFSNAAFPHTTSSNISFSAFAEGLPFSSTPCVAATASPSASTPSSVFSNTLAPQSTALLRSSLFVPANGVTASSSNGGSLFGLAPSSAATASSNNGGSLFGSAPSTAATTSSNTGGSFFSSTPSTAATASSATAVLLTGRPHGYHDSSDAAHAKTAKGNEEGFSLALHRREARQ